MTKVHPLYIDGPLAGKDFPVAPQLTTLFANDADGNEYVYRITHFGFHSGAGDGGSVVFLVGSCAEILSTEDLATYMLSDAAKAARIG